METERKGSLPATVAVLVTITLQLACAAQPAGGAQSEPIALMQGADRQKILEQGARKEGKLVWYGTLIVDQLMRPVKAAFEKEYPFIQVDFFRGNSERIAQKVIEEYQGRRYEVDIVDGTISPALVKKVGFMQRFFSPYLAEYPPELKDPQGYWGVTNLYFMTLGYNTRMVKPADVPRSWDDLLNPKWKGEIIWSTSRGSGAPVFIGNILAAMGREKGMGYLEKLAKQNVAKSTASARALLDLVIAGEYPLVINIFNHHAAISKKAGAPSEWQSMEPVAAPFNTVGLAKNAPHPHAAMLFLDFVLSKKGQKVFQDVNYLPAHPEIPAKEVELKPGGGRFKKANYINPDFQLEKGDEWVDIFQKLFIKG
jgi:ABC-type Fe3+ transport system substrate-binding protein